MLTPEPLLIFEEPLVGACQPLLQRDLVIPAKRMQAGHIQQFAWRTIRLSGVKDHPAFVAHDLGDRLRQFTDRAVHPVPTLMCDSIGSVFSCHTSRSSSIT
jgi:hypothetical protein